MRKIICYEFEEGTKSKSDMLSFYNFIKLNHSKEEPLKIWVDTISEGEFKKAVNAGKELA